MMLVVFQCTRTELAKDYLNYQNAIGHGFVISFGKLKYDFRLKSRRGSLEQIICYQSDDVLSIFHCELGFSQFLTDVRV